MLIGLLEVELYIPNCNSLKEKRFVLKSLKTKLRNRFNISVTESDGHDLWQRAKILVVTVSNDGASANSTLSKVVNFIDADRRVQLLDYKLSFR